MLAPVVMEAVVRLSLRALCVALVISPKMGAKMIVCVMVPPVNAPLLLPYLMEEAATMNRMCVKMGLASVSKTFSVTSSFILIVNLCLLYTDRISMLTV